MFETVMMVPLDVEDSVFEAEVTKKLVEHGYKEDTIKFDHCGFCCQDGSPVTVTASK